MRIITLFGKCLKVNGTKNRFKNKHRNRNIKYPEGQGYEGDINSLSKHYGVITQEDPRISQKTEVEKHNFIVLLSKDINFDDEQYKLICQRQQPIQ